MLNVVVSCFSSSCCCCCSCKFFVMTHCQVQMSRQRGSYADEDDATWPQVSTVFLVYRTHASVARSVISPGDARPLSRYHTPKIFQLVVTLGNTKVTTTNSKKCRDPKTLLWHGRVQTTVRTRYRIIGLSAYRNQASDCSSTWLHNAI